MQFAYAATLLWQLVWLGLLPPPAGPQNLWLAILACLPLLLPLAGVIRAVHSSLIYGGIVLLMYFAIAVTELWTEPAHLWPALFQLVLALVYLFAFKMRIKSASE